MEPSIKYVRKTFWKTNISYLYLCVSGYAQVQVRNVSFKENFEYVLNGWPQWIKEPQTMTAKININWYEFICSEYDVNPRNTSMLVNIAEIREMDV